MTLLDDSRECDHGGREGGKMETVLVSCSSLADSKDYKGVPNINCSVCSENVRVGESTSTAVTAADALAYVNIGAAMLSVILVESVKVAVETLDVKTDLSNIILDLDPSFLYSSKQQC